MPSCWDRLEPRKKGANWTLIPVWAPEMSAGRSQVPEQSVLFLCSFCLRLQHRQIQVPHTPNRFRECSFLIWKGQVRSIIRGKQTLSMLTLAQLKRQSGKSLCLRLDSGVHYQFNAWSGKRLLCLCRAESWYAGTTWVSCPTKSIHTPVIG